MKKMDHKHNREVAKERTGTMLKNASPAMLERLKSIPHQQQMLFLKVWNGASKPHALKAKCLECCNYYRDEVAACPAILCPLHKHRPFKP